MSKKLGIMLPILVAFLFVGASTSVFAAKPVRAESPMIISVLHGYSPEVLFISGENLAEDGPTKPIVTLDGAELNVNSWSPTRIAATPKLGFPKPGDYELLLDSNLKGTEPARMWVTLGAVGPEGPAGKDGADGAPGADGADGTSCRAVQGDGWAAISCEDNSGAVVTDGATGPKGEQGPQGIQGLQGPQGEQGPAGPKPNFYEVHARVSIPWDEVTWIHLYCHNSDLAVDGRITAGNSEVGDRDGYLDHYKIAVRTLMTNGTSMTAAITCLGFETWHYLYGGDDAVCTKDGFTFTCVPPEHSL